MPAKSAMRTKRPSSTILRAKLVSVNQAVRFLMTSYAPSFADMATISLPAVNASIKTLGPSSNGMSNTTMLAVGKQLQILQSIVERVTIDVVDVLTRGKSAAKEVLNHYSMLIKLMSVDRN